MPSLSSRTPSGSRPSAQADEFSDDGFRGTEIAGVAKRRLRGRSSTWILGILMFHRPSKAGFLTLTENTVRAAGNSTCMPAWYFDVSPVFNKAGFLTPTDSRWSVPRTVVTSGGVEMVALASLARSGGGRRRWLRALGHRVAADQTHRRRARRPRQVQHSRLQRRHVPKAPAASVRHRRSGRQVFTPQKLPRGWRDRGYLAIEDSEGYQIPFLRSHCSTGWEVL